MNCRLSLFLLFFFYAINSAYAEEIAMYRLQLNHKGNSSYRIDRPEEFLSQKSIDRRIKQGFPVDETDLPVNPAYFEAIAETGASVQTHSKWLSTIVVLIPDPEVWEKVQALPFVDEITKVWKGENEENATQNQWFCSDNEWHFAESEGNYALSDYGGALKQIEINNALLLHQAGYKGAGKTIAVMDAGFRNVDLFPDYFDPDKIAGVKNFTHEKDHPYRIMQDHGTMVLSCMLADRPGVIIGTAPCAQYYLFKTEVNDDEYPVEEDYWVAALEQADSLGVDIVTTSLGYSRFDDPEMDHTWDDLDGRTVPASRAAAMAAAKGMVLFHSAGNEGNKSWVKVIIPADAENILTVGAVGSDSLRAGFSSWGYIADGRMKPDVMAMGSNDYLISGTGFPFYGSGTSFSTPVLAGMGACLWEALPDLTSFELMDLIKQFSDRSSQPDEYFGYGIPNIYDVYLYEKRKSTSLFSINKDKGNGIYIDSTRNRLYLKDDKITQATVYSSDGRRILNQSTASYSIDVGSLQKGIYVVSVFSDNQRYIYKFIK
jgi:subtilisin family serine protease